MYIGYTHGTHLKQPVPDVAPTVDYVTGRPTYDYVTQPATKEFYIHPGTSGYHIVPATGTLIDINI